MCDMCFTILTASRQSRSVTDEESVSVESLRSILADKQHDLELAAAIGQMLLKRNELLESGMGSLVDTRQALEQQVGVTIH